MQVSEHKALRFGVALSGHFASVGTPSPRPLGLWQAIENRVTSNVVKVDNIFVTCTATWTGGLQDRRLARGWLVRRKTLGGD